MRKEESIELEGSRAGAGPVSAPVRARWGHWWGPASPPGAAGVLPEGSGLRPRRWCLESGVCKDNRNAPL